jgi:NADPH-dependent glutamate synthase beta subunit-like oxidoreductase/NAD(P)H-flavin reductase
MTGTIEAENIFSKHDFALGIEGFRYSDLFRAERLKDLAEKFYAELAAENTLLHEALMKYVAARGADYEQKVESKILTDAAPYLSEFVARLFGIERRRDELMQAINEQDPIWKYKFFVQRRATKKFTPEKLQSLNLSEIDWATSELRYNFFDESLVRDEELGVAEIVDRLTKAEEVLFKNLEITPEVRETVQRLGAAFEKLKDKTFGKVFAEFAAEIDATGEFLQVKAALTLLEAWSAAQFFAHQKKWYAFKTPHALDYQNLVRLTRENPAIPEDLRGLENELRRRDGFKLTDGRGTVRDSLYEVDYCMICHERSKDACSKGLHEPATGEVKRNPLGIKLEGCPLDEKISEMHLMKRHGDSIASLALVTIDNPMCAGTGHRICNDCMKACIFQKQEPVNIPLAETATLTDVLALPYGFEIYSLLTRWNPLNAKRPYALPYNGKNVLVIGLGPAGYTLAHYLLNEGFGVVGMDGLKIEPVAAEYAGANGMLPKPVRDIAEITSELDERILSGFGGVSEYGITVRWDKNFLTMLQLLLTRREHFRAYGGIRFGGTLTIEDAWNFGFDHIAIATGAGRPTMVKMKNNMIRGIRKASDFLMSLQLNGAFKKDILSNLQVRLPAVVIGGGLTGVDTSTEIFAYYPVQVEKMLEMYETLAAEFGEEKVWAQFDEEETRVLQEFLEHGKEIRAERERAFEAGEEPNFIPLVRSWGGVSLVYRKRLQDSPAYRLNHEEVQKALEEGIDFVELMNPTEAVPDDYGAVKALVFERQNYDAETKKFSNSGETVEIPARTVCIAAGTSPNVIYEKEKPGTFKLDEWKQFFQPHKLVKNGDGNFHAVAAEKGERAFFTSYEHDGKFISYYGDNHPVYAGNVVKAMASAKHGYEKVAELFADSIGATPADAEKDFDRLVKTLDEQLRAYVVKVERLTPTIVDVIVKAPLQARKFEPGQFYRLQNFESSAPVVEGKRLMMEGLALTGAWVDEEKGLLSMIVLEMGTSSRMCSLLKEGEEVVVMGPTGTPTEIPENETVLLAGGGLGNAVLFSIAKAMKQRGNRVIYFAGYKNGADLFKREEIENATSQVVWATDFGDEIQPQRPQDAHFRGNIVQAMIAYAEGRLGEPTVKLSDVDRIIAIGSDRMMNGVKEARYTTLKPFLKENHKAIGSINSPMQCMMKEVCAQCLQRHVNPHTGEEFWVFSCFNQDQDLDFVDFRNLNDRLKANSIQEKLSNLFLDKIFKDVGLRS